MEQRDHRRDSSSEEIVNKLDVEIDPGLVDGVIASAQGDDAAPGDGEAVAFCAGGFEEVDVFGGAVVRVASYVSRRSVGDLAWDLAEGVPD
jgi:hypothetical protein